ncbi:MAG: hypothetical protein LBR06_04520 [Bacteroidales bacterium]|jgi:hypothetical protein|nr:hypothetical protein [Bacteroidales bacterium]
MDIKTVIITLVALAALVALPAIGAHIMRKKRRELSLRQLSDFAGAAGCHISEFEILYDVILGLDAANLQLFFLRLTPEHETSQQIDLKNVTRCRKSESGRTIGDAHVIDRIDLEFQTIDRKSPSVNIYNVEYDKLNLTDEIPFAEKWASKITAVLKQST